MNFEGFCSGSDAGISPAFDSQQTRNLYYSPGGTFAKNKAGLFGRSGLGPFAQLPIIYPATVRALLGAGGRLFTVAGAEISGAQLIEVFSDGTHFARGQVDIDTKPAYLMVNGSQLGVVTTAAPPLLEQGHFWIDGGAGTLLATFPNYTGFVNMAVDGTVTWVSGDLFDGGLFAASISINGGAPTRIQSVQSPTVLTVGPVPPGGPYTNVSYTATVDVSATSGCFLDGYFIISRPNSQQFNISALDDGTSWDALDFAKKEGYPDKLLRVFSDHENLWLFGDEQSTEVWQNTGAANFPFQRIPGNFIHYGLTAKDSVVRLNNGVAWIAKDQARGGPLGVYAQGFVPTRVTTFAEEALWTSFPTVADAVAMSIIDRGHHLWVINFPTANRTRVFDAATSQWTEWTTNGATNDRIRPFCNAYTALDAHGAQVTPLQAQQYAGDRSNGKIYVMSGTYLDDNGVAFQRQRTAPHLSNEDKRSFYGGFQLDSQVFDPDMTLEVSDDGGQTYRMIGTPSFTPAVSTTRPPRTIWLRTGSSLDRIYRVTSVASIVHSWIAAYVGVPQK